MIINDNKSTNYEQPDAGLFLGTIIDVVDLGIVPTAYGPKARLRLVWVLDKLDSTGKPFGVIGTYSATMNEKSNFYKHVSQILGVPAPPVPFEAETLIGKSNQLFLVKTTNPANGKVYTNVGGILPLTQGQVGPKIPVGFVRAKDKPKSNQPQQAQTAYAGQQAQTASAGQPQQQAQSTMNQSVNTTMNVQEEDVVF